MTDNWLPPVPLNVSAVPPFPVAQLPLDCRLYAEDMAEAYQVPVDLPAMLMLAVGGACMANKYEVQATVDWSEPCNLYVCTVLPPANRKSAVFKAVTAALLAAEAAQRDEMALHVDALEQKRRIKQAALQKAEQVASREAGKDQALLALEEANAIRRDMPDVPALPRLLVDDITPEQLAALLAKNQGRLALLSAEGGVFDVIAGRYSSGVANLDVYLKGHSGDAIRVDRIGRSPVSIDKPALTIGLAVQPDVIKGCVNNASFRGRGLVGRFLYSMPPSPVGHRKIDPRPIRPEARSRYEKAIASLLKTEIDLDKNGAPKPRVLVLDRDAQKVFRDYQQEIENSLAPSGDLEYAADWGGKLPGAVLRVAAILHGFTHARDPEHHAIETDTMVSAILVGEYLKGHALSVLDLMGVDPALDDARHVLAWIKRMGADRFSQRDAYQALKGRFKRVAELTPALALIEEHHFIRLIVSEHSGPGRKPSQGYLVNPAHSTQSSKSA